MLVSKGVNLAACVPQLLLMDGVLDGAVHLVPLLVLPQLLLLLLQLTKTLLNALQQLGDLGALGLCRQERGGDGRGGEGRGGARRQILELLWAATNDGHYQTTTYTGICISPTTGGQSLRSYTEV